MFAIYKPYPISNTLKINFTIHAFISSVWKAWREPEVLLKWFASDKDSQGLHAHIDLQPGGKFEISYQDSKGMVHNCFGIYHEVVPRSKLVFSWNRDSEPGIESQVTVSFISVGSNTLLRFEQSGLVPAYMENYELQWATTFDKLDLMLNS